MNEKVADRMRRLCSRREYCVGDIRKKLMVQLEGNAAEAAEILEHLMKEKYIDDLRYASAYARDKASISGWGATKIRYMLSAKGIITYGKSSPLDLWMVMTLTLSPDDGDEMEGFSSSQYLRNPRRLFPFMQT